MFVLVFTNNCEQCDLILEQLNKINLYKARLKLRSVLGILGSDLGYCALQELGPQPVFSFSLWDRVGFF